MFDSFEDCYETWILTHQRTWLRYQSPQYPEQSEANRSALIAGAQRYRLSITAFDRSLADLKESEALVRLDGGNEETDRIDAAQRKAAREAQLDAEVVITDADYTYAASLSPTQLAEAYHANSDFARKYRRLQREFGFGPVPTLTRAVSR
jgi:hypothetical protein